MCARVIKIALCLCTEVSFERVRTVVYGREKADLWFSAEDWIREYFSHKSSLGRNSHVALVQKIKHKLRRPGDDVVMMAFFPAEDNW